MTNSTLHTYLQKIQKLNRNLNPNKGYEPHNPFLLLAVIELMKRGEISENRIPLSDDLIAIFQQYISLTPGWQPNIFNPFYALKNEGFWHLKNWSDTRLSTSVSQMDLFGGAEQMALATGPPSSVGELRDSGAYAVLDNDLFACLAIPEYRELIRQTVMDVYFPELQQRIEDFAVEEAAEEYSKTLISGAEGPFSLFMSESIEEERPVRSAGFRKAIMTIYDWTCAVCELNIRALRGESVTDAAHIIPFSVSHNDDVRNGISLCKSHHWAFDTGLISVDDDYQVIVSPSMSEQGPPASMLTQLRDKRIWTPAEDRYHPDRGALEWHRVSVLRG